MKVYLLMEHWYNDTANIYEGDDLEDIYSSPELIPDKYKPFNERKHGSEYSDNYYYYYVKECEVIDTKKPEN